MSDLVELKKLKNLIAVAEAGNISVAAKRLYLSQPSLSIQIKDLEDVMQVPLLVRDHKGVRATPAAEILITGGRELLRMRDEMIGMARALHRVTFVPMRLGFSSFVDHALYEMVCSIHTSLFPSCEIKPKSGDPVDLLLMLERGEIDAALVTLPASGAGLKAYQVDPCLGHLGRFKDNQQVIVKLVEVIDHCVGWAFVPAKVISATKFLVDQLAKRALGFAEDRIDATDGVFHYILIHRHSKAIAERINHIVQPEK
jgi:molybdenum-dependent DNA-binding transcriptional regulator ModE